MNKFMTTVEMLDGTIYGPVRVLYADKMKCERAARANEWDLTRDEITLRGFLSWAALTRTGEITMPYEAFIDQVADIAADSVTPEESDPTQAA